MNYYTGNSCKHVGYEEFEPTSWPSACAPDKHDWIELDRYLCGENGSYPEEFWACADFAITPSELHDIEATEPSTKVEIKLGPITPVPHKTLFCLMPAPISRLTLFVYLQPLSSYSTSSRGPNDEAIHKSDGMANRTPAPTEPLADCLDPVGPYDQCGGEDYEGSDCCREGYECTEMASCYSQCRPIPGGCSEEWDQCGGSTEVGYWEGPTCCWPGASCVKHD
ncbi:unnamed protein product, partial [Ectocarpus sp. 12 AP-2014]